MCPAVGVSLQELAIGAASRSTVARFLIDARRRDGVMTQCVGRLGLKQLPMPVDVPTSRLLALSYRLVDGSQTIQAVEARALLASSPSTSSGRTGLSEICRQSGKAKRPKAAPPAWPQRQGGAPAHHRPAAHPGRGPHPLGRRAHRQLAGAPRGRLSDPLQPL